MSKVTKPKSTRLVARKRRTVHDLQIEISDRIDRLPRYDLRLVLGLLVQIEKAPKLRAAGAR